MQFQTFASGSSGNVSYAASGAAHILIDAGISRKRITDALRNLDLELSDIDAVLLTHEHSDHIQGLGMVMKNTRMPVYATAGTIRAILSMPQFAGVDPERFQPVVPDRKYTIKDLVIEPIRIRHDAAEPVGYRIRYGTKKISICTDLGCTNDYIAECLMHSDVMLLESNHDVRMLQAGPYPYPLKQRILSERGHLSNDVCAELLMKTANRHLKAVFLGHLSKENNLPELAYETVRLALTAGGYEVGKNALPLYVAPRSEPSALIEF